MSRTVNLSINESCRWSKRRRIGAPRLASESWRIQFAFHPAAIEARERFVEWLVAANDLSGARLELEQLIQLSDRPVAARATERTARLMIQSQLPADAVYYYRRLESKFGDVTVRDNLTGSDLVKIARAAKEVDFDPRLCGLTWTAGPMKIGTIGDPICVVFARRRP